MENKTGEYVRALGATKVLIHYGGGSAVRSGLIARVEASLDAAGVKYVSLGGAQPNPRDTKVYEGIELIRREKVDFVLAVGGGSAIDSAKAMAHGALYDGDFWDFFCGKAKPQKSLPKGVVLTMSAAGSESSDSCVITQEATKTKRGLNTELNRPLLAIMDPELTMTLPPYQIACGATDILAHIMERYFTNEPDVDLTDRLCEGTMQAVIRAARVMVKEPHDYDAASQLMWASTIATTTPSASAASRTLPATRSSMSFPPSTTAPTARVWRWCSPLAALHAAKAGQGDAAGAIRRARMGLPDDFAHPEKTAQVGIDAYVAWLKEIGMPVTFAELGAREEDIPYLAGKVKRPNPDGTVGKFLRPEHRGHRKDLPPVPVRAKAKQYPPRFTQARGFYQRSDAPDARTASEKAGSFPDADASTARGAGMGWCFFST